MGQLSEVSSFLSLSKSDLGLYVVVADAVPFPFPLSLDEGTLDICLRRVLSNPDMSMLIPGSLPLSDVEEVSLEAPDSLFSLKLESSTRVGGPSLG